MVLSYFTLAIALSLSVVAAWYSIIGLTAIFASAVIPIIIMGGILEVAKITVTVWLHEYWHRCRLAMKIYLVPAVIMLMVITSMGIFGFLSKAHLDQAVPAGDISAQVTIFDEKIKTQRDNIDAARAALRQLDAAVDQTMSRSSDERGAERAVQLRRNQAAERGRLQTDISRAQTEITRLQEQRAPIAAEARKVEAEVGPIKYVAALIYGDNPDANLLERAVRWVIIILVVVFDPLAIMMVLAATESFKWERDQRQQDQSTLKSDAETASVGEPSSPDELDDPEPASTPQAPRPWPFPVGGPAAAVLTLKDLIARTQSAIGLRSDHPKEEKNVLDDSKPTVVALDRPSDQPIQPPVLASVADHAQPAAAESTRELDEDQFETEEIKAAKTKWKEENPRDTLKHQRQRLARGEIQELPWMKYVTRHTHGTAWPDQPGIGDTFVRIDQVPSQVYKFNGTAWIAVDKNSTDSYTYNAAYIDWLIDSIGRGEYDPELLTDAEQDQIAQRLQNRSNA